MTKAGRDQLSFALSFPGRFYSSTLHPPPPFKKYGSNILFGMVLTLRYSLHNIQNQPKHTFPLHVPLLFCVRPEVVERSATPLSHVYRIRHLR